MVRTSTDRIYVFGASGTGTTTLGARVAQSRSLVHVDCDDHYWAPADPPFSRKRHPADRILSMRAALGKGGWVLTGACDGWGSDLIDQADLIVFVTLPTAQRLARLVKRERDRFGARIAPGGDMHDIHRGFLKWSAGYDNPYFEGRSLARHEEWLRHQTKPIIRLDGRKAPETLTSELLEHLQDA